MGPSASFGVPGARASVREEQCDVSRTNRRPALEPGTPMIANLSKIRSFRPSARDLLHGDRETLRVGERLDVGGRPDVGESVSEIRRWLVTLSRPAPSGRSPATETSRSVTCAAVADGRSPAGCDPHVRRSSPGGPTHFL
jgi:hypothetical protein